MTRWWQWSGAVLAIASGDKYFEEVVVNDTTGASETYRPGDCVRISQHGRADGLAVITAVWETPSGVKMAELRRVVLADHVERQLFQAVRVGLVASYSHVDVIKGLESNELVEVEVMAIHNKVKGVDVAEYNAGKTAGSELLIIGSYDQRADVVEPLPAHLARHDRIQLVSERARQVNPVDDDDEDAIGQKRLRPNDVQTKRSREVEAAIEKLQKVCPELLLSHLPEEMTAREEEEIMVYDYLRGAIEAGSSPGALYISGLPGTGKTSIVREVIRKLNVEYNSKSTAFVSTEVNGLHLPKPELAYAAIWKAIMGAKEAPRFSPEVLCKELATEFARDTKRPVLLLVLDEMDFLVTSKSAVLYNVLEWQAHKSAKLVIVGIANTMDLPERLEQKVRSRLGTSRIIFSSYTKEQLELIVDQRLSQLKVFTSDAIQLACKHIAHASGDVRQALALCRRAVELAIDRLMKADTAPSQASQSLLVTAEDLHAAQMATSVSAPLVRLRDCRKFECVFLIALRMEVKRSDREEASFENVLHRLAILCNTHSLTPVPRLRDLLLICEELHRSGIIRQVHSKASRYPKLSLRCSPQEIHDVFLAHPVGRKLLT
ncbi:hypothetical protein Poli38472_006301 [Pythium oligandrum]|uniref:Origin recognition complex subunit 1 n=1 Tax=Pythium oligandrum TaxID=41045 RepID=A0A8K1FSS2_PYTOL|nr:hypothetical protein Poli38472_006301 [Pythium oligandrum]|eukprot:TMW68833.1 hypothetical protein Poli38472_006301 [Pythium oligandrum]